jgi:Protein of unknown function (DUF3303)
MKFMITYSYTAENFLPVVKAWGSLSPQERASVGDGAKKVGHWHDVVGRRAFLVVESDNLAAVARWVGGWNNLGDASITPVLDDEESGAVAKQVAAEHGG